MNNRRRVRLVKTQIQVQKLYSDIKFTKNIVIFLQLLVSHSKRLLVSCILFLSSSFSETTSA